jgi:nuclear pore complex protein Nup107
MYAGALENNAVERYAMFLTSLELTADINERRLALTRAREHGLNVHKVAVVTAEQTIDRAFEVSEPCTSRTSCAKHHLQLLPKMKGPPPSVIALQASPSDIELLLLHSIEWTTFEDETYDSLL